MTRPHRAGTIMAAILAVFMAAPPAAAQIVVDRTPERTDVFIYLSDDRAFVGASFAEPFTEPSQAFVTIQGADGMVSGGVELADAPVDMWTPERPPSDPVDAFWEYDIEIFDENFDPLFDVPVLTVVTHPAGGISGIGMVLPRDLFDGLGDLDFIQVGSGYVDPDYWVEAYDDFLPEPIVVPEIPPIPFDVGFPLPVGEGTGPSTPETTTTTTTVPTTTAPATTAPPTTVDVGPVDLAVAPEDGGGIDPLFLITAILILILLMLLLGRGRIPGLAPRTRPGRPETELEISDDEPEVGTRDLDRDLTELAEEGGTDDLLLKGDDPTKITEPEPRPEDDDLLLKGDGRDDTLP